MKLTDVPGALVGLYSLELFLIFLAMSLVMFFSWYKQIPSEFHKDNMGKIIKFLGFIMKACPRLVVILHYIILIPILVIIGKVASN